MTKTIARAASVVALLVGASPPAHAQSAVDGFDPVANGVVLAVAVQPDGKILVGGDFTMLGGGMGATPRNYLGRLNADGSLDASFDPGANSWISDLAVQPDGKILVAGYFTMLGGGGTGTMPRNYIGRLNADGSLDESFDPGANCWVGALALQPDGKILVGGCFILLAHTLRSSIGRLNADGSIDASFDPGANNTVRTLAVQPDGRILVSGDFTMLGGGMGATSRNYLGRLHADGSLDTSFNPGANAIINAFALQPDGRILVGGDFTMLGGGGTGTTPRNYIGRLNADGSLDDGFDPGADYWVYALAVQPDGKILVGGNFTTLGGGGTGTTPRSCIGRLQANGSLDTSFNPGANTWVVALAVQPDTKILVGGWFWTLGGGGIGTMSRNRIGRLHADGSLDADLNPGANGLILAMAAQPDGHILVGGGFSALGGGGTGTTTRNRIGRLAADGSLDPTFNPGADGNVRALVVQPDGKILVGGQFTMLGGGGTGTTPRHYLGRLNADGSLDPSFNPGANGGIVSVLVVQPDGKILVGGTFTTLGGGGTGTTPRRNLGRLYPDGSLDNSFDPGASGPVETITVQPDGRILVGGGFTFLGGGGTGTTPRRRLARLNSDGSIDPSFDPGANGGVYALTVEPDGQILVGGDFTTLGGGGTGTTTRNNLGRLNADGSLDTSFDPGANDVVNALILQPDGRILLGGFFTTVGGGGTGTTTRNYLGRLAADGALDPSFNPGANALVSALAVQADGKIVVGGLFTTLGGGGTGTTSRHYLGRLTTTDAAIQRLRVTGGGQVVTWVRSGAGPDVWRVTFESTTDGATYTPLGNGTRVTDGWQLSGQTLPTNQSLFIRARGSYATGYFNGSGSIVESISHAYVSCPTLTPTSLVAGTAGVAYSMTFSASGSLGLVSLGQTGTLPAGVTFSGGVFAGTPTQTGSFPLTLTATDDSSGCVTSQSVTLTVYCPTITLSATSFVNGAVGVAYPTTTLSQVGGIGTATFAVTSGAWPTGLTLSTAGTVSGMPTVAGTFIFTITATDTNGCTGTRTYTLTIQPPLTLTLDRTSLRFGAVTTGAAFVWQTAAQIVRLRQSGAGTVTWTATPSEPWLQVSPASGSGSAELSISVVSVPGLPIGSSVAGAITLTVLGAPTTLPPITVVLDLLLNELSAPPFGVVDTPAEHTTGVTGAIPFTGWALDDVEVTRVMVCRAAVGAEVAPVDPNCGGAAQIFVGVAVFIDGARPDVAAYYPTAPLHTRAGWGFMVLTNMLPDIPLGLPAGGNGTFQFFMYAQDRDGHTTLVGTRTLTCANASATKPFGAIDTPTQGGLASGAAFVNFGWALTPQPKIIPVDGSTITVFIDGVAQGALDYNHERSDIEALFPSYQNTVGSNGAVGFRIIDTTTLANGLHTISWTVVDDQGGIEGIGSRFFTVSNGAGALTAVEGAATSRVSADVVAATPLDDAPVVARRGWDTAGPWRRYGVGRTGRAVIRGEELDRFELTLGEAEGARYTGSLRTSDGLAPLPIGSHLDATTGVFTWAPGVGFVGAYDFVFVRWVGAQAMTRQQVRIVLAPKASGAVGPQVVIDVPRSQQAVAQPFVLGGWAADLSATMGTGIATVHAWAYPLAGGPPVFLGAAAYGGARPDVAAVHGEPFRDVGFGLVVQGLAPGHYDLAVFAWSTEAADFVPAKVVRVTVR